MRCFALLIRTELAHPGPTIMNETTAKIVSALSITETQVTPQQMYNRAFTLHGAIMIFLFVIPAIPSALGNFILPLQLGAKDVAFPRLNLFSYHLFFFGTLFFVLTLVLGGIDTGWTFYAPYSVRDRHGRRDGGDGRISVGVRFDLHRSEFPGHRAHAAPPGSDLVQDAADGLVAVCHGHHPVAGHSGAGHHAGAAVRGTRRSAWASSIPSWVETRFCSSTSSGSIRIRPCTS